jgi:hypothetical protein
MEISHVSHLELLDEFRWNLILRQCIELFADRLILPYVGHTQPDGSQTEHSV